MKVFFDNCTSHHLAAILGAYLAYEGHEARHIRDLPCGPHAHDPVWIDMLGRSGDRWMVITGDVRIQRNKSERAAYRQASLTGFVLAPAFQKIPHNQVGTVLLWHWPSMLGLFNLVQGPALYELPINRSSRFRPLPL